MIDTSTHGAVSVIKCDTPLTADVTEEFEKTAQVLISAGQPMVVLDMSEILLVNSAGLELLLDMKDSFNRRGGSLKLASPNPLCLDILRITGEKDRFEIHDGLIEALGSFGK